MSTHLATLCALLLLAAPSLAAAQEAAPPKRSILVLQLDDQADVMTRGVAQALAEEGFAVWDAALIDRALGPHIIPAPDDAATKPFVGLDVQLNEGIRSFFYLGEAGAIERLREPVALGMRSPEVLIHRPDWAGQIIDAAVVLVRAYAEGSKKTRKDAIQLAAQLARTFPSHVVTDELVPPETLPVFEEGKKLALATSATLTFIDADRPGCRLYLNGAPVTTASLTIAADTPYAVRHECGAGAPFAFRVQLAAGQSAALPLTDVDPRAMRMRDDELATRAAVERAMRFVSHITAVPSSIGVSRARGAAQTPQERYLFVRVEQGAGAVWSDGTDPGTMRELLVRVLPELDPAAIDRMVRARQPAQTSQPAASDAGLGPAGWAGIGALVLGAGGLAASAYFSADASDLSEQLRAPQPSRAAYDQLANQHADAQSSGQIALFAGAGLAVVGAGLLIWALTDATEPDSPAVTLTPTLSADGAGASLSWSF